MKYGIQENLNMVLFLCGEKYMEVEKMNNYCCCNTRNSGARSCGNDSGAGRCAALFKVVLIALPAFIAVAALLAVLFVIFLVLRICNTNRSSCGC